MVDEPAATEATAPRVSGMDADVIGLNEIENTTGVEVMADIVAGLNDVFGAGTYDYIDTGTIGTDAIKVGFIYRTTAVTPVGPTPHLHRLGRQPRAAGAVRPRGRPDGPCPGRSRAAPGRLTGVRNPPSRSTPRAAVPDPPAAGLGDP